ncbi:Hypothetical predicted protein [Paramuricea clavata]|uniref:Uncharacterized protein n=1 Tax=Paramuricea clavata TaxID=317549 RepID=A0A7D9K0T1_PARCT|nr:Hypothetical predicted protein [Paramuricea clavata]
MATSSSGVKSWLLDKYAKQVEVECRDGAVNNAVESMSSKGSGEWKQISSLEGDGSLQMTLIEDKHLMLSSGSQIRESFALVNTAQWLKTYCKGDSVLFVVRMNNGFRRFRVKFANTGIKTGMDNCMDFVKVASPILPMKVIPLPDNMEASQSQFVEDSQAYSTPPSQTSQAVRDISFEGDNSTLKEGSSLPDIARQITSNDQAGSSTSTNLPTTDLSTLIRLCLSDPGFPNFVDKVEKELKLLTTQK